MINWKVRFKNKLFWASAIPALVLAVQAVTAVFGVTLDLGDIGNKVLVAIDAIFVFLAALGVVTDHTTSGISDSEQAMTYTQPK